jgi:hypothetical protein
MFHTEQVFAGAQLSPGLGPFSKELSGYQPKSGSFDKTSKVERLCSLSDFTTALSGKPFAAETPPCIPLSPGVNMQP